MSGAGPGREDRLGPRLPLHHGLHDARPDRGHDLRRRSGRTSTSINMWIGGLPALNDGNNARAELYNRLIEQEERADVHLGRQQRPRREHGRRPVGRDQGDRAWARTSARRHGCELRRRLALRRQHVLLLLARARARTAASSRRSSRPGSAVSTIPTWQPGGPVPGTYTLPPGYAMFNGTSMASPQAAGAAALLISAAKATGVQRQAGAAPQGDQLHGPLLSRASRGARAGQRRHATSAPPGTC